MFDDLRTFWRQVLRCRNLGMCSSPFQYYFRWKRSMRKGASSVSDELAWVSFQVIDFLNKNIGSSSKVFEYGGGGSTLFFLRRANEVVTVEHNEEWFKILSTKISKEKAVRWKGAFVPAEKGLPMTNPDAAVPEHYYTTDEAFLDSNFRRYASHIDTFPEGYFDCVVVDGRSRPSCLVHAMPQIKEGGFLVLDNSEREYYREKTWPMLQGSFESVIDHFSPTPYSKEFTRASVWVKKRKA